MKIRYSIEPRDICKNIFVNAMDFYHLPTILVNMQLKLLKT